MKLKRLDHPLAIAMWDFSWLERRWPGAGYEDWDLALDELAARGYDAVRIDAYPHLVCADPAREWTILPCWNQNDWGSPARNRVRVQPSLNQFIRKCRERGIAVGLSSWFQQDAEDKRLHFAGASHFGRAWKATLDTIAEAGLLDAVCCVDLCNEWPFKAWAPFFNFDDTIKWDDPASLAWMAESVAVVRGAYPDLAYTYSHVGRLNARQAFAGDVSFLDFLEPHVWMVHGNDSEFYRRVDYHYERFSSKGYENVAAHARSLYDADRAYWDRLLVRHIDGVVEDSLRTGKPLITTECWSIVDYKDWPLLDWEWVKESCAVGVRHAAASGRWLAMATSNFCGPQFRGMWRDIEWHREMTRLIKSGALPIPTR